MIIVLAMAPILSLWSVVCAIRFENALRIDNSQCRAVASVAEEPVC